MPAGRVAVVMLVALVAWSLLYGPELRRSAEAHPDGVRRDVSLAIVGPIDWVSRTVRLVALTDGAGRLAGRDPGAALGAGGDVIVDDLPSIAPDAGEPPAAPPVRDTSIRVPTNDKQLRVVIVGDSLAAGLGYYADRVFHPPLVDVNRQGRISTGLARPDYFNWMGQMKLIVDRYRPDLTIVMVGENDNQPLRDNMGVLETDIGTPGFVPAYEERVERFAKIATSGGGHVVWVGMPVIRDEDRWFLHQRQNTAYEAVADRLPNVAYVDTFDRFSRNGKYWAFTELANGKTIEIRTDDGLHFTPEGYALIVRLVAEQARQEFDLDPRTYLG
jgi:hypothetical protein